MSAVFWSWVDEPWVRAVGWSLVHFVWQGLAVAALFALALWLLCGRSAAARYAAGCAALALMAALPAATWVMISRNLLAAQEARIDAMQVKTERGERDAALSGRPGGAVAGKAMLSSSRLDRTRLARWHDERLEPALPWLISSWALGVLVLSGRLLGGWMTIQSARRLTLDPPAEWSARLTRLSPRLRISRAVVLRITDRIDAPSVLGWLRPMILIPTAAMSGLSAFELEAILAHELAHVRRHDYVVNLLQSALEVVLFYHPAVWWVSWRVRQERENCCDDIAAEACGDTLVYAKALAAMETLRVRPSLAMAATGGTLVARVRRLIDRSRERRQRVRPAGWWPATLLIVAMALSSFSSFRTAHGQEPASRVAKPASQPATQPREAASTHEFTEAELTDMASLDSQLKELLQVRRQLSAAGVAANDPRLVLVQNQILREANKLRQRSESIGTLNEYYISGVPRDGAYTLGNTGLSLLRALISAKFDPNQNKSMQVVIIRRAPQGPVKLTFSVAQLVEDPKLDVLLEREDIVMVRTPPPKGASDEMPSTMPQTHPARGPARLEMRLVARDGEKQIDELPDQAGDKVRVETKALLDDSAVESARSNPSPQGGWIVELKFTEQGAARMRQITATNIRRQLAIVFDGRILSAPVIQNVISSSAEITDGAQGLTRDEADEILAALTRGPASTTTAPSR